MDDETAKHLAQSHAARAFDDLRSEVSLLRRAIEGLTAERQSAPDYSETLGEMAERLTLIADRLAGVAKSPAMRLTPQRLSQEIVTASEAARAADHNLLQQVHAALAQSIRQIDGVVEQALTARRQTRWLAGAAVGGIVAGIVLWSVLPGLVARAVPAHWYVPEKIAARIMREDMWSAGVRLARAADTERWRTLAAIDSGTDESRKRIAACRKRAKGEKRVSCVVRLGRTAKYR